MDLNRLITKYNRPGPRYTSYPTAPQWKTEVNANDYRTHLQNYQSDVPLALYVHIPFCEALCYFCACNKVITKDASVGAPYVDAVIRELETVSSLLQKQNDLTQISWGGGTPTYLPVEQMERLFQGISDSFGIAKDAEISIEVDPRVTSEEQLECLSRLGFNRISLGVQDFDLKVQKAANRVQSLEMTQGMLEKSRELGFSGINFDLIYGLPHQTLETFTKTVEDVVRVGPDRIALYNYARLPNLVKHQTILEKFPIPDADTRIQIFEKAFEVLTKGGYRAIGMDHFAKESDELWKALENGSLYRNFMGYTVKRGTDMIGVGCSAIGEIGGGFFQNIREHKGYQEAISKSGLATFRGFHLSPEDELRKWVIQTLMCQFEVSLPAFQAKFGQTFEEHFKTELPQLDSLFEDGILEKTQDSIRVTPLGRLFVRNAAMIFDEYLQKPSKATYSKTV